MGSIPTCSSGNEQLEKLLEKHSELIHNVNNQIHDKPELAYEEHFAHDTLCNTLEALGYKVTRHAYGLNTAFEAESGQGGALITYNAEYDALPGIGHACGHNLIAASSLAAFLITADAMRLNEVEGRVRLLGTPAEEAGGGKIDLLKAGAYQGVDACLMGHPDTSPGDLNGVILVSTLARASATVTFRGVNAHAGYSPWMGKNALDAAVAAYTNLSMLRQQIQPNQRLHAIISKGGDRPNVIPHLTEMMVTVRAETDAEVQQTCKRVIACLEGAATAAGCTLEVAWDKTYKDLRCSNSIAKCFQKSAVEQGLKYQFAPPTVNGASTDQGNVSYELPSLHPSFNIPVGRPGIGPHQPDFAEAAGTRAGFDAAMKFGKAMAATGLEIVQDKGLRDEMWAEHRKEFGVKE